MNQDRAVLLGTAKGSGACGTTTPCVNFLNPASFGLNPVGTYGNISKGEFTGPNYIDWDMGLFKNFNVIDHAKLQFRAEFLNVFNHTNLLDPTTSVSSAGFGSIKSANNPRSVVAALVQ